MQTVLRLLLDNLGIVLSGLLALLAYWLGQKKSDKEENWWTWFNEVAFFAFDNAEKKGILEGLPGEEKLKHYLEIYRAEYLRKWGTEPSEMQIAMATARAAELSAKEGVFREANPIQVEPL